MQFTGFIRKVFATKILLSGKLLLFVTLKWDKRLSSFIQTQRVNLMRLDVLNTFLFSSENLAGQLKKHPVHRIPHLFGAAINFTLLCIFFAHA